MRRLERAVQKTMFAVACVTVLIGCATPFRLGALVAPEATTGECVIMMHGLARSDSAMRPMRAALIDHGYLVISLSYPSRKFPIEVLSEQTLPALVQSCRDQGARRLHFVTHSLGGILVRHYLERESLPDLGRIVMLAPPNQGSEVTDNWRRVPGYAWMFGPAGQQLGTGPDSVPSRLGPVQADTGVIAGTRSINMILSLSLPNPDDGKVSVASTRVEDMCAHLQLPISHPFIMKDGEVITEVLTYLATGKFISPHAEYPDCPFRENHSRASLN